MTLTNQQTQILDSIMPEVVKLVMNGMDVMEAVKKCLLNQIEFCGEMAMQETSRAKEAKQAMFEIYCERKGLN